MKYSLALPVYDVDPPSEYCTAQAIREMATLAEDVGFSAVYATEHPFPSRMGASMGGHHALDLVVCMSFVAAFTKTLRLHLNAFVPTYRNPFLAAKSLADLDVMSGGRLIAGLVGGYLEGEFAALGVKLQDRSKLMDEALIAMKAAWTGEPVNMESERWAAKGNVMLPRPHQRPHPPLWIGGNARATLRRVAKYGQGWVPIPATTPQESTAVRTPPMANIDDLRRLILVLREEMRAAERENDCIDICIAPFTHRGVPRGNENYEPAVLRDEAAQLADAGVTWLAVKARSPDRKTLLKNIERWGREVINP